MEVSHSSHQPVERNDLDGLHWGWIGIGVLIGAVLISLFASLVQFSARPEIAAFVVLLSIMLAGILASYYSRGETIREAAVAALVLVVLTAAISTFVLDIAIPLFAWFTAPLFVPGFAMLGAWTGELLQGTLEEAYEDRVVDWPWVIVSVVLGFTLSAYAVVIGREVFAVSIETSLWLFAGSFFITGWIVGFFSPGNTMVEPAIAGMLMVMLDAGFVMLWFAGVPPLQVLTTAFGAGIVLALAGAVLGEFTQRLAGRRQAPR